MAPSPIGCPKGNLANVPRQSNTLRHQRPWLLCRILGSIVTGYAINHHFLDRFREKRSSRLQSFAPATPESAWGLNSLVSRLRIKDATGLLEASFVNCFEMRPRWAGRDL